MDHALVAEARRLLGILRNANVAPSWSQDQREQELVLALKSVCDIVYGVRSYASGSVTPVMSHAAPHPHDGAAQGANARVNGYAPSVDPVSTGGSTDVSAQLRDPEVAFEATKSPAVESCSGSAFDLAVVLEPFVQLLAPGVAPPDVQAEAVCALRRILACPQDPRFVPQNTAGALVQLTERACTLRSVSDQSNLLLSGYICELLCTVWSCRLADQLADAELLILAARIVRVVFNPNQSLEMRAQAGTCMYPIMRSMLQFCAQPAKENTGIDPMQLDLFAQKLRAEVAPRRIESFSFPIDSLMMTASAFSLLTGTTATKSSTKEQQVEHSKPANHQGPQQQQCSSRERPLVAILLFLAAVADPQTKYPTVDRVFASSLIACFLRELSCMALPFVLSTTVQRVLSENVAAVMLRILCSSRTAVSTVSNAFEVLSELICIEAIPCRQRVLAALLEHVFPIYIHGMFSSGEYMNSMQREIGLEALKSLLWRGKMISVIYSSFDCNPYCRFGLASLLEALCSFSLYSRGSGGIEQISSVNSRELRAVYLARAQITTGLIHVLSSLSGATASSSTKPQQQQQQQQQQQLQMHVNAHAENLSAFVHVPISKLRLHRQGKGVLFSELDRFERLGSSKRTASKLAEILSHTKIQAALFPGSGTVASTGINRAAQVAVFLKSSRLVDRATIGTILGEPDEFSVSVLTEFARLFSFQGLDVVHAMRLFLAAFHLQGEAQKIDRIMHAFATQYFEQNCLYGDSHAGHGGSSSAAGGNMVAASRPLFNSADAVYVLAFSIIMLNTDRHNHMVKTKMSLREFKSNNRGINDGADFDEAFLEHVYDSIAREEIKMSKDYDTLRRNFDWTGYLGRKDDHDNLSMRLMIPAEGGSIEAELFADCWRHFASAADLLLNETSDLDTMHNIIGDFLSLAHCSIEYSTPGVVDELVKSFANSSMLLSGPLHSLVSTVGTSVHAQMCMVSLFRLAREYHDRIGVDGWGVMLGIAIRLHVLGLFRVIDDPYEYVIPPERKHLRTSDSTIFPEWWPAYPETFDESDASAVRNSNGFSSWYSDDQSSMQIPRAGFSSLMSSVFGVRPNELKWNQVVPFFLRSSGTDQVKLKTLRRLVKNCVADCRMRDIFVEETRFISTDSLNALLGSLCNVLNVGLRELQQSQGTRDGLTKSGRPLGHQTSLILYGAEAAELSGSGRATHRRESGAGSHLRGLDASPAGGSTPREKESAYVETDSTALNMMLVSFCCDLFGEITIQNKDRLNSVWPLCCDMLDRMFSYAEDADPVVERCVVSLLKLSIRLLQRNEVHEALLTAITWINELAPEIQHALGHLIVLGLYEIIRIHGSQIQDARGLSVLLALLGKSADWGPAAALVSVECLKLAISIRSAVILGERTTFELLLAALQRQLLSWHHLEDTQRSVLACLESIPLLAESMPDDATRRDVEDEPQVTSKSAFDWKDKGAPLLERYGELILNSQHPDLTNALIASLSRVVGVSSSSFSTSAHSNGSASNVSSRSSSKSSGSGRSSASKTLAAAEADGASSDAADLSGGRLPADTGALVLRSHLCRLLVEFIKHSSALDGPSVVSLSRLVSGFYQDHCERIHMHLGEDEWSAVWLCVLQSLIASLEAVREGQEPRSDEGDASIFDVEIYSYINECIRCSTEHGLLLTGSATSEQTNALLSQATRDRQPASSGTAS
ncbi:ARF guanine-nucleotide exchange factor GNL1 [Porphyridium purpureum]|uniref:ARF guanine-nucleotide exchange factor GNL1 n=1 Tax=Porphyridium purpureum TaxID=35688 RepID=A0A5J4YUA2_PORPP|nr:ARF guanine-nucleotide exchange factor GNL1 [Porphyridium purpureum]|eukprot:POR6167..scf227_4